MQKSSKRALTKLDGLLNGALRRHGVMHQVASALVVERANDVLDELILHTAMRQQVFAVSFDRGTLVIGCVNAGASYEIDGMQEQIRVAMKERMPEIEIVAIVPRVQIETGRF